MDYQFKKMSQQEAEEIAFNWHYEGEYSFYDMEADEEDLQEFLDPELRGDTMFAVHLDEELTGFFSMTKTHEGVYDIGLGMRPDLTGSGMGAGFLNSGVEFVKTVFQPKIITLSVATFNQRAITVYRKAGFVGCGTFMQATNGGEYEFLRMEYVCQAC
ncbi:GNAT family N-acetyltransferase [Rossellomorea aquimaris]|uniref:GNAT family N-acetyltransferase n=1 Tax=Rossellomorea aquimaris TaxID=189382 RepID=UPI001CD78AD0|nr:GNAT family protein [Rossellomorea aquimaris]MCA1055805.1 GNAT family N-acetyltransferase [Rossellomorea aquimaris]